ncbi:MAG TPA: cytochrome c biogenesis protein CcsA [Balneolaceae bacterium]|nr:cytochrome c biogenesis protein CcsA [Balneolaceae bacterium]
MKAWKYIVAFWLTGVIIASFLIPVPNIAILKQSSRNLLLHVPMWFTMAVCFFTGFIYSIKYLSDGKIDTDRKAAMITQVGLVFGVCGLLTGSLWARFTWGTWWTFSEPKMNLAALGMTIYVAYFVLRMAFDNPEKRAKISAVFNVFAATTVPFLFYIIPRQLPSLHPGANGNPAFSQMTAPQLRYVFYPAVIGFIALAFWLNDIGLRYKRIKHKIERSA